MTELVQLQDVSEVVSKGSTPTSQGFEYSEAGVPFLRAEDVQGGPVDLHSVHSRITHGVHGRLTRSQLKPFDLLVTIAGTLGRVGFVPSNAPAVNCNQAVAFARLKPELIDVKYACYACQSPTVLEPFLGLQKVGTIGNLNLEQLRNLKIPLPSLPEQQRIAGQLEQADQLRRARRYALEMCDELLPAVFLEMFGDLKSSESRWPVQSLGDSVEAFEGGINFNPVGDNDPASDWRVLKVSAVSWREFLADESKPISPTEQFDEKLIVKLGDLIMSRANTIELVGAVARVRTPPPPVLLPDKLWRLKFRTDARLLPDFVLYALRCRAVRHEIELRASGTSGSMKNISKEDAGSLRLPIPPLPLQQRFENMVTEHERLRTGYVEALRQAEHLFQTLLHQAFSTRQ
jgi:type I restriction enzyme, S subunit